MENNAKPAVPPDALRVEESHGQWWIFDGDRPIAMCTRKEDAERLLPAPADALRERVAAEIHLTPAIVAVLRQIAAHWNHYERVDTERPGSSLALASLELAEEKFRGILSLLPAEGPRSVSEAEQDQVLRNPEQLVPEGATGSHWDFCARTVNASATCNCIPPYAQTLLSRYQDAFSKRGAEGTGEPLDLEALEYRIAGVLGHYRALDIVKNTVPKLIAEIRRLRHPEGQGEARA